MQAISAIVDAERLSPIVNIPDNLRNHQVEIIILPFPRPDPERVEINGDIAKAVKAKTEQKARLVGVGNYLQEKKKQAAGQPGTGQKLNVAVFERLYGSLHEYARTGHTVDEIIRAEHEAWPAAVLENSENGKYDS